MKSILDKLGIDETFSKRISKPKNAFNEVKTQIPNKEDYNMMADVLHLPTDKNGYKYCLTVVDLATDEFDIEPMKELDPDESLSAIKKIFNRKNVKLPYSSIRTDGGNEFKGAFDKFCYDNNILHSVGIRGRHQQQANVESLHRQLGRLSKLVNCSNDNNLLSGLDNVPQQLDNKCFTSLFLGNSFLTFINVSYQLPNILFNGTKHFLSYKYALGFPSLINSIDTSNCFLCLMANSTEACKYI
jgi:hypothetical protein